MKLRFLGVASFFVASIVNATAHADSSCRDFRSSSSQLADRTTYVKIGSTWQIFNDFSSLGLPGPTRLKMMYIVKDDPDHDRAGIIIIKTGHVDISGRQNVTLVRNDADRDNDCRVLKSAFGERSIDSTAYDRFHDHGSRRGLSTNQINLLQNYHTSFGSPCRRSDGDPGGFGRHVSNRASFSYDIDVVDQGSYTAFRTALSGINFGTPALAEPTDGLADRRTEIRHYTTSGSLACVPVDVPFVDQGSFLRINDLAAPIINGVRERRY